LPPSASAAAWQTLGTLRAARLPASNVIVNREKQDTVQEKTESPKREEKTYRFEIRDKSWSYVFEWYRDISGLPFVGSAKPTGTVTIMPPIAKSQYTLGEITDLLNEALLEQKYILVRRVASFTVLTADQKIDPALLPRVRVEDLAMRGRTELVTVMLPLKTVNAEDLGAEVKKMLGPFGDVAILEKFNQLILQDTAGNLRRIHEVIKDIEAREAEKKREKIAK
jgi:type II secretory pathway component GspD/PulD (secretin)